MMNREIKFRAWDENDKIMRDVEIEMTGYVKYWDEEEDCLKIIGSLYDGSVLKQIPVMQYTGLKDKNGKEIYDGDILSHDWGDGEVWCEVVFIDYEWRVIFWRNYDSESFVNLNEYELMIIGNKFSNPELLESK